jgi:hypothetical protein
MADHNAIAEKLDQLSLNFRKRLGAVLRNYVVPANFGKLFVGVCNVDGPGVAHKSVEDGFALIIDNGDAAEDLADVGPHHFAVDGDFLGENVRVCAYCLRESILRCMHLAFSLILRFEIKLMFCN